MTERGAIELVDVWKWFRHHHARSLKELAVRVARREPLMERRPVLRGVNLHVAPGERLGIVGRNGAGKSTLFRVIGGIYRQESGTVSVGGRVSPLIELTSGLVHDLTGAENIRLNAAILGLRRHEIEERFATICATADIDGYIDTPLRYYSSGMQARLAFAVAVNVDADILLVDEVLAVGDAAFQERCLAAMEAISRAGKTIVVVSHDERMIRRFCHRVVELKDGVLHPRSIERPMDAPAEGGVDASSQTAATETAEA